MKILDSGFRRNDGEIEKSTFYETINFDAGTEARPECTAPERLYGVRLVTSRFGQSLADQELLALGCAAESIDRAMCRTICRYTPSSTSGDRK